MRLLVITLVFLILTSFKADLSGFWNRTENNLIIVYSRPEGFTKTNSPDSLDLQKILLEQNQIIDLINQKLNTNFDRKVEIYLFNFDEAEEKMGTNGGGYCSSKKPRIYFTYYDDPIYNTISKEKEYIGVHEMVHIITRYELGDHKTKFFGEGYANAIDRNYGAIKIGDSLIRRTIDTTMKLIIKSGNISTPTELLYNDKVNECSYYPQVGCLFNWLFAEYGVDKINAMYTLNARQIDKNFEKITGDSFKEMERKYLLRFENK